MKFLILIINQLTSDIPKKRENVIRKIRRHELHNFETDLIKILNSKIYTKVDTMIMTVIIKTSDDYCIKKLSMENIYELKFAIRTMIINEK